MIQQNLYKVTYKSLDKTANAEVLFVDMTFMNVADLATTYGLRGNKGLGELIKIEQINTVITEIK